MALSEPSVGTENEEDVNTLQSEGAAQGEAEQSIAEVPNLVDNPPSLASTVDGIESSLSMRVKKRNGDLEEVDVNKIVNAVARCAEGLPGVDPMRVATRTISALADGSTTRELD